MFKNIELQKIADWCNEREILPNRVVILDVKAACRSLGMPWSIQYQMRK